jgi:hypothetical protein
MFLKACSLCLFPTKFKHNVHCVLYCMWEILILQIVNKSTMYTLINWTSEICLGHERMKGLSKSSILSAVWWFRPMVFIGLFVPLLRLLPRWSIIIYIQIVSQRLIKETFQQIWWECAYVSCENNFVTWHDKTKHESMDPIGARKA